MKSATNFSSNFENDPRTGNKNMPSTARPTTTRTKHRTKPFRLTTSEREMILTLFLDGYRPYEIAKTLERAYMTVATAITDAGYIPERYRYTEQEAGIWQDMYAGNGKYEQHCVREIAEVYACPMSRVSTALLRRGSRMRHPALAVRIAAAKRRKARQ